MGKKHKKESKKRKHRSRSRSTDKETEKDKRKHHKRHHKLKKKEKCKKDTISVSSQSDDDVVYVPPPAPRISKNESSPPPAPKVPPPPKISSPENPPAPPPPTISASSDNSLSIEQTNALRAKLGLKPLAVPKAAPPSQTENASKQGTVITSGSEEFVHKPAENLGDKKETEKLRERLAERKAKREIEKKLSIVATLGQASDDDESTSVWVKKSRKITEERFKAEQKAKELDEMDEVFGIGDLIEDEIKREKNAAYTAANLKGLTVDHDLDGFSEGKSVILTLKDKDVLADEEDALVNVNMVDDERYKKNVANKNLKPFHYNGIDPGEMDFDEPKTVLSKYDEEIEGVKKTSFKIGEEDVGARKEAVKQRLQQKTKMKLESLSLPEPKIASEYYTPTEMIKIKKPKKKKKIRSKMLRADDLLQANGSEDTYSHLSRRRPPLDSTGNGTKVEIKKEPKEEDDAMDIDEEDPAIPNEEEEPVKIEIEDDAELQLALKKARRLKQMPPEKLQSKLPKVEEVLEQIKEEPEESDPSGSAIVLNSTAEFCRTLGDIPTYGLAGNRDEDPGILLDFETERDKIKKLDEEIDDRGGWNDVAMDEKVVEIRQAEAPILDAEPDLGSGISGALRMAVSKGYLEKEATSRPSASRFAHLAAQNYSIDDKAHAVEDEKLGRRERYLGPTSDFKEKDGYKPNIKLEYIDDDGHILSAKEAFRYLSHKFHGKGPGKNKVEKRMKKNEQEGLMKQMSSTDTPLGTLQMLQQKQKETQSAFVVLSGSKQTTLPPSISKTKMLK